MAKVLLNGLKPQKWAILGHFQKNFSLFENSMVVYVNRTCMGQQLYALRESQTKKSPILPLRG